MPEVSEKGEVGRQTRVQGERLGNKKMAIAGRGEGPGESLPCSPQRNQPCLHLDFRLPASRTGRRLISVVEATWFGVLRYDSPGKLTQQLKAQPAQGE